MYPRLPWNSWYSYISLPELRLQSGTTPHYARGRKHCFKHTSNALYQLGLVPNPRPSISRGLEISPGSGFSLALILVALGEGMAFCIL